MSSAKTNTSLPASLSARKLTNSESLRFRTERRNMAVTARFDEMYAVRTEGMRFDADSIIDKLAAEFYISAKTVIVILRNNVPNPSKPA